MANQITHIVLAEKVLERLFKKFDKNAFLVGTVFPDIRYLKVIDRDKTHIKGLAFQDILEEQNSFIAGMKYHSLTDEIREKYVVGKGTYDLIPSSKFITQALKTYEDEVLYSNVPDWDQVIKSLDSIFPEETDLVETRDGIKKWHFLMQEYFKEFPTDRSREGFIMEIGFSKETSDEINELLDQMRLIPNVRQIILEMYEKWESLLRP